MTKTLIEHSVPDLQCDCCATFTTRLHFTDFAGLETWACDRCCQYDAEAYGEAEATYQEHSHL